LSMNSGTSAPGTTAPGLTWLNTSSGLIQRRNLADSAWLSFFNISTHTFYADIIGEVTSAAGVTIDGVLLKDGGGTFTGTGIFTGNPCISIQGSVPRFQMYETDGAADEKYWQIQPQGGKLF